jgi:uncharacterized protein YecT (DUF1311 family)
MRFGVPCVNAAILVATAASAEPARCPHTDADACEEWKVEQLDQELAAMMTRPSPWIDRLPVALRDDARTALQQAQQQWIAFREAECRRELTWSFGTARTKRGFLAWCRHNMTLHRRDRLQELYRFTSE